MPKSYYLDNSFLNTALRGVAFTPPGGVYVALYTVAPTPSTTGVEVMGGAYTRQLVSFGAPINGQTSNSTPVVFPIASAAWGTVVAFGIMDAAVNGNLLYFANLSVSRSVQINDQVQWPAGQLVVTEA